MTASEGETDEGRRRDGFTTAKLSHMAERLLWTPPRLKWDSEANNELSWGLCFLYAATTGITVANLYYCYPILHILAAAFDVSGERASLVPTLLQCGYACGLLFIIPIGDITRRRPLIIGLIIVTAVLFLGLIITDNFTAFIVLSFISAITGCTPQLMLPLTVQFSPLRHRATMTSIIMSGLVCGIAGARVLSGIVSQYVSWRVVYWIAFGLQLGNAGLLALFMPDYPVARRNTSYLASLWMLVRLPFRHPLLTQQSLIAFLVMGTFTCFWTTLTFELTDAYRYNALKIGLFSLIAFGPVLLNPVVARLVTSRIHPSGTLLLAHVAALAGVCIGTFVGDFSIAGLIVRAFFGDLGINTAVVANRIAIAGVDPTAQNAVNSVYTVVTFCGQLSGTAAGNKLYAQGGWIPAGALMVAFVGLSLLLVLVRGPHETGWVGWRGGWDLSLKAPEKSAVAISVETVQNGEEIGAEEKVDEDERHQSGSLTIVCDETGDDEEVKISKET